MYYRWKNENSSNTNLTYNYKSHTTQKLLLVVVVVVFYAGYGHRRWPISVCNNNNMVLIEETDVNWYYWTYCLLHPQSTHPIQTHLYTLYEIKQCC